MVDVSRVIDYENGELDQQATFELFQDMINDGTVWQLQGHYGRTAVALIAAGHCTLKEA